LLSSPDTVVIDQVKIKVCLIGPAMVGKTSLARRFVFDEFDDRYLATLGAKVSKKVLDVDLPPDGGSYHVVLTVWDIMGEKAFVDLLQDAYFRGAAGLIAVTDVTRPETFEDIASWIGDCRKVVGPIPVCLVANKIDLVPVDDARLASMAAVGTRFGAPLLATSAKTGQNVAEAFEMIARLALADALGQASGKDRGDR
jgi:small GTP-binding protein